MSLSSPLTFRTQGGQIKDWNYVDAWLQDKFNGKPAAPFERNAETLKALLALVACNETADEEAEVLSKIKKKALAAFETIKEKSIIAELVEHITHSLTAEGQTALRALALCSYTMKAPECSVESLASSVANSSLHEDMVRQQLERLSRLNTTLRYQLETLKKEASVVQQPEGFETANRQLAIEVLKPKIEEYRRRARSPQKPPSVTVADIISEEREIKDLRSRVQSQEAKVKGFNDLPTEKRLARGELDRVRILLEKLEGQRDALFENLLENDEFGISTNIK